MSDEDEKIFAFIYGAANADDDDTVAIWLSKHVDACNLYNESEGDDIDFYDILGKYTEWVGEQ